MKYIEAKKENGVIIDNKLCQIVERLDYDFSKFSISKYNVLSISLRAKYFDSIVETFIRNNNKPVIVTLGCGLDTRKYRIHDNEYAIFYEIDLPNVIKLRQELIPALKNDIYISKSIFDKSWMNMILNNHSNSNILFIMEGILMYLDENDVCKLFQQIAQRFNNSELHFDAASLWKAKHFYYDDIETNIRIKLKYGFDNDLEPETWANNIKHSKTIFLLDIDKKKWGFIGIIFRKMPKFYYSYRILSYTIN